MNLWWLNDHAERYWLETTDRADIGTDLNAPAAGENGRPFWAYSLVQEVKPGDIVLHYRMPRGSITSWSRAVGSSWTDNVVWGAHAPDASGKYKTPYKRPGWRLGLEGPFPLRKSITLAQLRARERDIKRVRTRLAAAHKGSLYFPFELSNLRPLRPTQFYLTKMPAALVALFPSMSKAGAHVARRRSGARASQQLGIDYVPVDEESATTEMEPFSHDPSVIDRGRKAHKVTQNMLAEYVKRRGYRPKRPGPGDPQFDLAWDEHGVVHVAEVKSLTDQNEEKQLRLGLGQVLRYRQLLSKGGKTVVAVLAVERKPSDSSWNTLCRKLGIDLLWQKKLR